MRLQLNARTMRFVLVGIVFLLGLYFLYLVRGILLPFVLAIALSYVLNPAVTALEQGLKVSRLLALIIVYLAGFAIAFLIVIYVIPIMVRELDDLSAAVPRLTLEIQKFLNSAYVQFRNIDIPQSISRVIDASITDAENLLLREIRQLGNTLIGFFSQLISVVLAPILAFYLLKDWTGFSRRLLLVFPVSAREDVLSLWSRIDRVLFNFIRGHLLVASMVGVLTALGLLIVGMDYVLLLSVIAGVTDLIPYFGPIIGAVPAVTLAYLQSKTMAFHVLVVMVVVQQLESNVISPNILGDSVGLHPITVVFALLAGGTLFGIIGLLLAVPAAAVLRILFEYIASRLVG